MLSGQWTVLNSNFVSSECVQSRVVRSFYTFAEFYYCTLFTLLRVYNVKIQLACKLWLIIFVPYKLYIQIIIRISTEGISVL